MRDELPSLQRWQEDGVRFAMATVVATSRSAPRQPGATLGLHPDGQVVGSVSGGCVEGAVAEIGERVLETGIPERARFGISDDEAFAVGLTCGGTIDVFVRPVTAADLDLTYLAERIAAEEPVAIVTVVAHPDGGPPLGRSVIVDERGVEGTTGDEGLDRSIVATATDSLSRAGTHLSRFGRHGERHGDDVEVVVESVAPRPRMLVFGAIDHAAAVAAIGRFLGYRVTVCDARATFATDDRFPDADEVVVEWPHRYLRSVEVDARTAICVLTHDPKFDVPVLEVALGTPAGYIGVMGSRRTHEDRLARLRRAGVAGPALARLRSPIGLDLGGRTPQETAISIASELVLLRNGGTGRPLTDLDGPIHHGQPGPGEPAPELGLAGLESVPLPGVDPRE